MSLSIVKERFINNAKDEKWRKKSILSCKYGSVSKTVDEESERLLNGHVQINYDRVNDAIRFKYPSLPFFNIKFKNLPLLYRVAIIEEDAPGQLHVLLSRTIVSALLSKSESGRLVLIDEENDFPSLRDRFLCEGGPFLIEGNPDRVEVFQSKKTGKRVFCHFAATYPTPPDAIGDDYPYIKTIAAVLYEED